MAIHSSTLAWKIPWMEEPGRLQSKRQLRVGTAERLHFHFSLSCIGEGNGNPLQCSCLENPTDGGAWWAAVYGVAQSWTRLKQLSSSSSSSSYQFRKFLRIKGTQYVLINLLPGYILYFIFLFSKMQIFFKVLRKVYLEINKNVILFYFIETKSKFY